MKKTYSILAATAVMLAASAFALSPDDKNVLAVAEKQLASYTAAPYPSSVFASLANRLILTGEELAGFQEMVSRIDKAAAQVTFKSPETRQEQYNGLVVTSAIWRFNGRFIVDGYKFAQENAVHDPYFVLHAQKLGISEADELAGYIELFNRVNKSDLWIFKTKNARFTKLLNNLPEADAKAILKKLNRLYSPKLVEDKAAFEPVVIMLRTMLETY